LLGSYQVVSLVVSAIARDEFGLVTDRDGFIDLPKEDVRIPEQKLEIRQKQPTSIVVPSSEMPTISKKSTNYNSDGRLIDIED